MRLKMRRNPILTPIEGAILVFIVVIVALTLLPILQEQYFMYLRK